jgi:hypothetical protein
MNVESSEDSKESAKRRGITPNRRTETRLEVMAGQDGLKVDGWGEGRKRPG